MKPEITVVIADDHPIFRRGLRQIIETDLGIKVVAETDDGEAALAALQEHAPQVAVIDVDMPNRDGFDVMQTIRAKRIPVAVIFLTMHKDERIFNKALDLGVTGYVLKDSAITEIVAGIKAVAAGQNYVSPAMSTSLLKRAARATVPLPPGVDDLTPTERRILKLIGEYKTSKGIATELFISTRTVEHHRANISLKLGLKGSHALLKFALDHHNQL
jgi:two-component system, NarL family, response regulator DegU